MCVCRKQGKAWRTRIKAGLLEGVAFVGCLVAFLLGESGRKRACAQSQPPCVAGAVLTILFFVHVDLVTLPLLKGVVVLRA